MTGLLDLFWIMVLIVIFNSIATFLKRKRNSFPGGEESRGEGPELFAPFPKMPEKTSKRERNIALDLYEDVEDFSDEKPDWIDLPYDDSVQRPAIPLTLSEVSISREELPGRESKAESGIFFQTKSFAELTTSVTPLLNLSPAGVLEGIVWSEILQPPRCQRPYHRRRK